MYLILILAAFLFAVQFLFNQQYRQLKGEGLDATMTFSLYTSAISFVILLTVTGKWGSVGSYINKGFIVPINKVL